MLHDLIGAIALDKKNLGGKLNVVLLKEIGKSYTYPTTTEFFTEHDRMVYNVKFLNIVNKAQPGILKSTRLLLYHEINFKQ